MNPENFPLTDVEIFGIQKSILSGNSRFSHLLVKSFDDSIQTSCFADNVVIGSLGILLAKEWNQTSYFRRSFYSFLNKDRRLGHFFATIQEWSEMDILVHINCEESVSMFSRSRLLEKIDAIVNNDQIWLQMISSYCNLPIMDINGNDISEMTGIPPVPFISDILFNIFMDDIDQEIENRLAYQRYARYNG